MTEVVVKESEVDILEKIKIAKEKDEKVVRVVKKIKKIGVKVLWEDEWQVESVRVTGWKSKTFQISR